MKKTSVRHIVRLVYAALCLALALVLPFLTGQIPEIGKMLCPMHLPVLLCGFLCGWPWGLAVGIIAPLMRSAIFQMPILYPVAISMAFELGAYGAVSGLLFRALPKKKIYIFVSLIAAMLVGRVVMGLANTVLLTVKGNTYTFAAFLTAAFAQAFPGILLQLVLVPVLVMALQRARLLPDQLS